MTWQNSALVTAVPPMLSFRYVSQFGPELGYGIRRGIDEITWPSKPFFIRQGWVMLLQGVLSLGLILIVFRYRPRLTRSERWQFVAQRPIALGLFAAGLTVAPFYDMSSATFTLAWIALVGIAFVRLMDGLVEAGWKRQVVYGAMLAVLTTRLFFVIGVPLPLFRLYIVMVAGVLVALCLWWAAKSARHGDAPGYAWALYLAAGFYAIVLLVELGGKAALAEWLFDASLRTLVAILAFGLLRYLIRGASEWAVQSSLYQRLTLVRSHETAIVQRLMLLTDILVGVVFLSIVLMFWRVYDSFYEALSGLLALGFTIGTQQVTLALVVTTIGILYGAFLISGILQRLLMDVVLIKRNVETGVKVAIAKLVHYALVFIGFVMALSMLGFKFTQLTIMMSALGVGIGFGLQAIVNNFLCGLILLFERPIRVGDTIELNGQWAQIQKIGLRSTTVRTFDQADVIVPNSDLISNQVTNWTLTDRQVRIIIPVGVAYGSDVPLVMQTLNDCAADNTLIMRMPEPLVFFRNFGESSLDFELRAWVWNVDNMLRVESDLRQEINRRFQEAGIVIAFPQRDVHVYQADNLANSRLWLSMEQPERLASDDTARQSTSRPDL